jgi:O-antigen ligase
MVTATTRNRLISAIAVLFAVWLGFDVASGQLAWPAVLVAGAAGFCVMRVQPYRVDVLLLAVVLFGYIAGNRGFAQFSLTGSLPLLPAEFVLLVAGTILAVQSAWRRELPVTSDLLNGATLAWIVVGTARLYFDLRSFGIMALRDFAMVYYAAFFFIAQAVGRDPAARRFLIRCTIIACFFALIGFPLSERFPEWLGAVAVRGVPLILYKGDLVGTMLAFAGVYIFVRYEAEHRRLLLAGSILLLVGALATNNRASMLGVGVATAWLALARRWKFALAQVACGALATLVILGAAYAAEIPWEKTPLYSLYERAASIIDPRGQRIYQSDEASSKGDNNVFRVVWWRAVIDETLDQNPYVGVGFGYDLAETFVREYYPETAGGDFSARSPHNIILTIFARMGALGLLAFLAIIAAMSARTWRALRRAADESTPLWCGLWVILISACFGVVLEGPMGAVVFWSLLGLANAPATDAAQLAGATSADAVSAAHAAPGNLRNPAPVNQLIGTA